MSLLNGHMSWQTTAALSAAACVTSAALAALAVKARSGSGNKIPQKWIRVGTVSELMIYPVKGCQGTHVREATLTKLGLKGIFGVLENVSAQN